MSDLLAFKTELFTLAAPSADSFSFHTQPSDVDKRCSSLDLKGTGQNPSSTLRVIGCSTKMPEKVCVGTTIVSKVI